MAKSKRTTGATATAAPGAVREAAAAYVAAQGDEAPKRKNFYLSQSKIDIAKQLTGARTETEAVDVALDMLIYGEALALGTESLGEERYHDVLGVAGAADSR